MEPTLVPKLAPYLVANDARGLIRFLETGLGGHLSYEQSDSGGRLVHAEVRIADAVVMLGQTPSGSKPFTGMVHLYVPNADAAYDRALKAGATSVRPPEDVPEGGRRGGVADPFGNQWWFSHTAK
jgi:PhnB protein